MSHDSDAVGVGSFGVQKSKFTQQTTKFSGTATIDVVINGQNVKQTLDDFFQFATLAVLQPVGGAGVTPILEISGADNNIRGISDGPGILTTITGFNDVEIKHNFQVGVGGVAVLKDPLAASPTIRSIVAGTGIAVASNNGAVQISFTGGAPVTNTVIVNSVGDFPTPVANVITLDAGTVYLFESFVDIGVNRIVFNTGNAFFANDRTGRGIVSDNAGACITVSGSDKVPMITDMLVNSTAGKVFDINTGAGLVINNCVTFQSAAVSTFADTGVVSLRTYSVVDVGLGVFGMLWSGTCAELNTDSGFCRDWTGVLFDFGTAVFTNGMTFGSGLRMEAKSGATCISGAAASANLGSGAIGLIFANKFLGVGTAVATILPTDAQWDFHKNEGFQESRTDAILSMHGNSTDTIIGTINTPVLVAGTFVVDAVSQMTGTTAGRATYNAEQGETLPLSGILKVSMASGGAKDVTAYIAINGTFQPNSGFDLSITGGTPVFALWQALLSKGDFVEIYIENNSDTTNITVTDAILRIN